MTSGDLKTTFHMYNPVADTTGREWILEICAIEAVS